MRLALLCDDPAIIPCLDAIAAGSAHEIVVAVNVSPLGTELLRGRSGIRIVERWEDLLVARDIDAILVGGHEPTALEAIKQLATAGQTILFIPDAAQGSTFLYELSLIRDDNRVKLVPALWHRRNPALVRLQALLHEGSFGAVKLIQLERTFCKPPDIAFRQTIVDYVLLPDLDLLRWLGGDYNQATAIRTGVTEEVILTQTVTLAGRGLPEATWLIQATPGRSVSTLTIHTERGQFGAKQELVMGLNGLMSEWVLTEPDGVQVIGDRVAAARECLDEIESSLARTDSPAAWADLVKVFETVDATRRSVTRRRTIDLHFEPMSERAAFKTQMIAMGCGVLTATLLLMLAYLAVASLVPSERDELSQWLQSTNAPLGSTPPASNWRHARTALAYARLLVFTPLAIFLVLQLLYPLSRPTTTATTDSSK